VWGVGCSGIPSFGCRGARRWGDQTPCIALTLLSWASQDDLAARCTRLGFDIGRGTISRIETGLRGVSDLEMVLLAKALRVKLGRAGARRAAGVAQGPAAADGVVSRNSITT